MPADSDEGHNDVYQRAGGVTALVSTDTAGTANIATNASFRGASADGSKVFFATSEPLAASDTDGDQVDVFQRSGGATTQVSTNTAGNANDLVHDAYFSGASADGSKVFFGTTETMAVTDGDGGAVDVYERSDGVTTQISTNTAGNANVADGAFFADASTDGSKVFFRTHESMAASDTDGAYEDVFERSAGVTKQVSTNTDGNANGAFHGEFMGISDDGSKAFFGTPEALVASAEGYDVYERSAGVTTQVSVDTAGNDSTDYPAYFRGVSADGSKVFFDTQESLAASDADGDGVDIFERSVGATTQVSTNTAGDANTIDSGASFSGASANGTRVFFWTPESMAATDADGAGFDVYERSAGVTTQVSTNAAGNANAALDASFSSASADGTTVFFQTPESMAASDSDGGALDVFQRATGATVQVSTNTVGDANAVGQHASFSGSSADGSKVILRDP